MLTCCFQIYTYTQHCFFFSNWMGTNLSLGWTEAMDLYVVKKRLTAETHSVHGEVDTKGVVQLIQELHKAISLLERGKKEQRDFAQILALFQTVGKTQT